MARPQEDNPSHLDDSKPHFVQNSNRQADASRQHTLLVFAAYRRVLAEARDRNNRLVANVCDVLGAKAGVPGKSTTTRNSDGPDPDGKQKDGLS